MGKNYHYDLLVANGAIKFQFPYSMILAVESWDLIN